MKINLVILSFSLVCFFQTQAFALIEFECSRAGVQSVHKSKYRVKEEPKFVYENYRAFQHGSGPLGALILTQEKDLDNCKAIDNLYPHSKAGGYVKALHKESQQSRIYFEVSSKNYSRFYDANTGQLVYLFSNEGEDLVVSDQKKEDPGIKIDVIQEWKGQHSKIKEKSIQRITNLEAWKNVWSSHSDEAMPEVDFDNNMIIAIFGGEAYNRSGFQIKGVRELDSEIIIKYDAISFQTMRSSEDGGYLSNFGTEPNGFNGLNRLGKVPEDFKKPKPNATPYGIFVLPRKTKMIRLLDNVQNYIGGPEAWKEKAVLEKL